MRTRLIVAKDWDGGSRVISGPGTPSSITDEFKVMLLDSKKSSVASIELWDSGAGVVKRKKFNQDFEEQKPAEQKQPVKHEQSNRHIGSVRNVSKSGGQDINL
jgi:hypothetical protein